MPHAPWLPGQRLKASRLQALDTQGTYVPMLTATTTDPVLGADGFADGWWHRNGHLITGGARFLFSGAGVDNGSGFYLISLPFDADVSILTDVLTFGGGSVVGSAVLRDEDTAANRQDATCYLHSANLIVITRPGSVVSDNSPFVWADGDRISVNFAYLADSSALP